MNQILIIDDEEAVRNVLEIALTEKGYEVAVAENGKKGLELFKKKRPEIVLTDVMMPEMTGLEFTRFLNEMNTDTDVIVMTGYGTEEVVIEALHAGASNYIKKPILFEDLFSIIDRIITKRKNKRRVEPAKDAVVFEKKDLVIGNDLSTVWGAVNQLLFNLHSGIDRNVVEGMRIGLYEIIVNAIEHGNLGITYEEKSRAQKNNSYVQLLQDRKNKADEEEKKVRISSTYDREWLIIQIKDDGKGFDYRGIPEARSSETMLASHGRGIFLTSLYFDTLSFIDPGNAVRLTKKLV